MRRLLRCLPLLPALLSAQSPAPSAAPSRIARVIVSPAQREVAAGDTLRLTAEARDAAGAVIPGVQFRFSATGGRFEGNVDQSGLVTSGSTGILPVAVAAILPGERPVVERLEVRMVSGPAARIAIVPAPARLAPGQRIRLTGEVYSRLDDRRADRVTWRSSNPAVARVNEAGLVTAIAAGRATITAAVGAVTQTLAVQVLGTAVASLTVTPGITEGRTGDVIRFRAVAKDAAGREIAGLTPTWSFTPGQGVLEADGTFVGYEAGDYTVTASFGNRTAEAAVT
ncbi:MAG: hypothetical protein RL340_1351, partial [Gemmatimonadota bacterium]